MSDLEPGLVEARGLRFHTLRSGGAKPPLVLAHGFADSGACWASTVRVLSRDWDVVAFDARGHGDTDAPADGYSTPDRARDLLAVLDALRLEHPVLMGHSMGGESVAWAEVLRPGSARALVLEDAGLSAFRDAESGEALRAVLRQWIQSLKAMSLEDLVAHVARQDPRWPEEDRLPWAESKQKLSQHAVDGFDLVSDLTEHYAEIACPVLLLKADAGPEQRLEHRAIVDRLPEGEIVHVEGAGHNVRRDEAARTAYHLGRFLAGV